MSYHMWVYLYLSYQLLWHIFLYPCVKRAKRQFITSLKERVSLHDFKKACSWERQDRRERYTGTKISITFFVLSQRFLRYPSVDSQPEFGMALRNLHGFCRQKSDDRISSWFFLKLFLSCHRKGCTAFCDRTTVPIFREFTETVKRVIDCSPT